MNFKIDENLPAEFAETLRAEGFGAQTVGEERLSGASDDAVFAHSCAEERTLVTLDLDFSNIRAYSPEGLAGIIVIRSKAQDKFTLLALLRRLIFVLRTRSTRNQLWIVGPDRIRFREG